MDSAKTIAIPSTEKTIIQTDSGRLEIENTNGLEERKATLYDKNGKVLQTGMFLDNKAAGAWIKYDAFGNVISAEHYSAGKPIHELDKTDFSFRTWENKQFGAKFSVPKNWREIPSPNPATIASFEKEVKDSSTRMKPNFNVARAQLQPGDNLDKLAMMQIQLLHENMERVEVVEESYLTIDSCKAFRRFGKYYSDNVNVGFLDVIIVSGNTAWLFSCASENNEQGDFLKYQGLFQEIVESFQRVN